MNQFDPTLISLAKGSTVREVIFVMDYIQLMFESWGANIYESPVIVSGDHTLRFPDAGSRDPLVSLVGTILLEIHIELKKEVLLGFSNGMRVIIPLNGRKADQKWESVTFTGHDGAWWEY